MINTQKINKKELKIALISAISATANKKDVIKKYGGLKDKKVENLPLVVESKLSSLKTKELISSLKKILGKDLFELADLAGNALKKAYKAEGFNIGANVGKVSGHSIPHFHLHIIPRHKNDSGFLDLVAHTAVMEEKPRDTIRRVKTALKQNKRANKKPGK